MSSGGREQWASRLGLVLAMAGNSIGLGNFLRFPRLAVEYGGGAFMIPYFIALLLLGVPLMWVEWSMGRFGGQFGHSTTPGMFAKLWKNPLAKYLGSLGIALPLLITIYYTYIESWTLAYACFSISQPYRAEGEEPAELYKPPPVSPKDLKDIISARNKANPDQKGKPLTKADWTGASESFAALDANGDGKIDGSEQQRVLNPLARARTSQFLNDYQGASAPDDRRYFQSLWPAIAFWVVTVALNCLILGTGIAAGIERLAKIAMPLLFLFAFVLAIRVLTYTSPTTAQHGQTVWSGMNFIWQPRFIALADFNVWLAAAGQIFFTLSVGTGSIQCYASYMKKDDDIALTGLTTAATNEFAEVILGGSIAIPIAVATFGLINTQAIAGQGTFNLGFVAMPIIFEQIPLGWMFGTLWFSLLFFAGITSSVALAQPFVAFLQDEFGVSKRQSATICGLVLLGFGLPIILWLGTGYLDQIDFWAGTFGLAAFGLLELVMFAWIYGGEKMWEEINRGADIPIPRFVYHIICYVAPIYLLVLLTGWTWQNLERMIRLEGVNPEHHGYVWMARGSVLGIVGLMVLLVCLAAHVRKGRFDEEPVG